MAKKKTNHEESLMEKITIPLKNEESYTDNELLKAYDNPNTETPTNSEPLTNNEILTTNEENKIPFSDFFKPNDSAKDSVTKIPTKISNLFNQLSIISNTSKQDIMANILEIWAQKMYPKEYKKMIKDHLKNL